MRTVWGWCWGEDGRNFECSHTDPWWGRRRGDHSVQCPLSPHIWTLSWGPWPAVGTTTGCKPRHAAINNNKTIRDPENIVRDIWCENITDNRANTGRGGSGARGETERKKSSQSNLMTMDKMNNRTIISVVLSTREKYKIFKSYPVDTIVAVNIGFIVTKTFVWFWLTFKVFW